MSGALTRDSRIAAPTTDQKGLPVLISCGKLVIKRTPISPSKVIHVVRNKLIMKRIAAGLLLQIFFLFPPPSHLTSATTDVRGAKGNFQFSTDSGQTNYIDFNAVEQMDGSTVGEMTFAQDRIEADGNSHFDDQVTLPARWFYLKAEFDCLVVKQNKAVMSGTVSEANLPSYVGLRVLLVVEDNDQGTNGPKQDRLTWGFFRTPKADWLQSDAERSSEQQGTPTWLAQDSERADDEGVLSNQSDVIGCNTFPISAFSFVDKKHGHGKIHVNP